MAEPRHITLRELQRAVKRTLDEQFELPVWVSAEIAEIKVNYSGHCYLELVEKGGANGVPTAQARAMIWSSNYPRIAAAFATGTGERLTAGLHILAKALVTYHEIYGFSLQITDIDPAYTLGDMARQRQQTIQQLQQEGVWEMNREICAPAAMQRIAVVSSAQAAGFRDFCKELEQSPYRFRITLFDAFVQGAEAENSIIDALGRIVGQQEEFDAVALIRGGGSASDLNCFNAYRLCAHVAQFPLPVLTGIGHDKDTSIADMVAFAALKTPTAVAGWLVERSGQLCTALDTAALRLAETTRSRTHAAALELEKRRGDLRHLTGERFAREKMRLAQQSGRPADVARELLAHQGLRLDNAAEIIAAHSPERLLQLGFALLRSGGRALTSAAQIQAGDEVEIRLADGSLNATINHTTLWQKKNRPTKKR
ncbi:exodeoxyribonuclease VII large subunit [uncultured Alistipes sp.]|jgi:exodeoxyribonuclease VII large subunit|uniref:exodeoxyribonuclease VII large subunit n=1 Tax=uncultured Alistipes sp. TaxID=538949 RepID=UPI0026000483|nr:exodeoxyribonuclease VII large subunit [uncultured Alistipes sp.]